MATLDLTAEQVLSLVRQLPLETRRSALMALAREAAKTGPSRMRYAEEQLRRVCAARGLAWESMTDEERERFVDELLHEDKSCR